eukprot:m.227142 g.227142  ORF g.227142 m.227142 type:complete len:1732 (-) comp33513_c0_seq1:404-5599(-)
MAKLAMALLPLLLSSLVATLFVECVVADLVERCSTTGLDVDITFLNNSLANVVLGKAAYGATLHNSAELTSSGVAFDTQGSHATIPNFPYAANSFIGFTFAFWISKEECTSGMYEYVYSHAQFPQQSILSRSNSNINMYIACEGHAMGSFGGSIMRYELTDGSGKQAFFDYPLHDAGAFDEITNRWIHFAVTMEYNGSLSIYVDGDRVPDDELLPVPGYTFNNEAYKNNTINLSMANMSAFNMTGGSDIFLGARTDLDADRHFKGILSNFRIYGQAKTADDIKCIFSEDEETLPGFECDAAQLAIGNVVNASFLNSVVNSANIATAEFVLQQAGDCSLSTEWFDAIETRDGCKDVCANYPVMIFETSTGLCKCSWNCSTVFGDKTTYNIYTKASSATVLNSIALHGQAEVDLGSSGVAFDANGSYITVDNVTDYARSGGFSISYWFSKEECSTGPYEYIYSHVNNSGSILDLANSNINMFFACEGRGMVGNSGGSVMRFLLTDAVGKHAWFDYPLHAAGEIDAITDRWIHLALTVSIGGAVTVFIDGIEVENGNFATLSIWNTTDNAALTNGQFDLKNADLGGFAMNDQVFLGGRADLDASRHFKGRLALAKIFNRAISANDVACIFEADEKLLPGYDCGKSNLTQGLGVSVSFLGDATNKYGPDAHIVAPAKLTPSGIAFDANGSYATVDNTFDYYSGASGFTISFWMTKENCSSGIYEYVYSHAQSLADGIGDRTNSNINMYIGCETAGGGWGTKGGSVLRFHLVDTDQKYASFDYPLHDAGQFDAVTGKWIHVVLTVASSGSVRTYIDGLQVDTKEYGCFVGAQNADNAAWDDENKRIDPSKAIFGAFDLRAPIVLGARKDLNDARFFKGKLALLRIYNRELTSEGVECLFAEDERKLPVDDCSEEGIDGLTTSINFLGSANTSVKNGPNATLHGSADLTSEGIVFDADGSYATVTTADYAKSGGFTVSFWMTKETCTQSYFEYIFSQAQDPQDIYTKPNAYINLYIMCEGHSASQSESSVLRVDLQDSNGTQVFFDFPLHDAGDFDAITDRWIHVVLAVAEQGGVELFIDGDFVENELLNPIPNWVYPDGSIVQDGIVDLTRAKLTGFDLVAPLVLGTRADFSSTRHFLGRLALVRVFDRPLTPGEVSCIFHNDEALIPGGFCDAGRIAQNMIVNATFLDSSVEDEVGGGPILQVHGHAEATLSGMKFDGNGSYVTVNNIPDYADKDGFAISFWVTKESCTSGPYEYIYSHTQNTRDITSKGNSNIDMYIACEGHGTGSSDGTVLRYVLEDVDNKTALFDYPLHDAGQFDSITNRWIHFALVVDPTGGITIYSDGVIIDNGEISGPTSWKINGNPAYDASTKQFDLGNAKMSGFNLNSSVTLGGRADLNGQRHFNGRIALLSIHSKPLTPNDIECLFAKEEEKLRNYPLPSYSPTQEQQGTTRAPTSPLDTPTSPGVYSYLVPGCASPDSKFGPSRWGLRTESIGQVQCCTRDGECSQHDDSQTCFDDGVGGNNLVTYKQAKDICQTNGLIMCSRFDDISDGCCNSGCGNDGAVFWRSEKLIVTESTTRPTQAPTPSPTTPSPTQHGATAKPTTTPTESPTANGATRSPTQPSPTVSPGASSPQKTTGSDDAASWTSWGIPVLVALAVLPLCIIGFVCLRKRGFSLRYSALSNYEANVANTAFQMDDDDELLTLPGESNTGGVLEINTDADDVDVDAVVAADDDEAV